MAAPLAARIEGAVAYGAAASVLALGALALMGWDLWVATIPGLLAAVGCGAWLGGDYIAGTWWRQPHNEWDEGVEAGVVVTMCAYLLASVGMTLWFVVTAISGAGDGRLIHAGEAVEILWVVLLMELFPLLPGFVLGAVVGHVLWRRHRPSFPPTDLSMP